MRALYSLVSSGSFFPPSLPSPPMADSPAPPSSSSTIVDDAANAAVAKATKAMRDFVLPSLRTVDEARDALWGFSSLVLEGLESVSEEGPLRSEWSRHASVSVPRLLSLVDG